MIEVSICRTCGQMRRVLNNFGECQDCTIKRAAQDTTNDLTMGRFIAMLSERGLSAHLYSEPRHSRTAGNYTAHLIDICKDGKRLETYQASIIPYFTEEHMAYELDKITRADYDNVKHTIVGGENES